MLLDSTLSKKGIKKEAVQTSLKNVQSCDTGNVPRFKSSQKFKTLNAISSQPLTMLQISEFTGIYRANICRHIAELKKEGKIVLERKSICPVSGHCAGFYAIKKFAP